MSKKKRKKPKPPTPPMSAEKKRRRKEAKAERQRKYQWVFMNGKQVKIKRPETIDGLGLEEYIRRNACDIWLKQEGRYDILDERYRNRELYIPPGFVPKPVDTEDDELPF